RAQAVVKEVSWLTPEHRTTVDALMAGQFEGLGPRKLAGKVRAHAERLDQHGALERNEIAYSERRVTVRPAAYGMAWVTALVSTQQAVGILATLTRDANSVVNSGETADPTDPTGQPRGHGQIMADLFVQRVNGHAPAAVPAEVQVVMTDEALFADGDTPAWVTGHGPIPAQLAKRWLAMPETDVFLRRVFARPGDHQLVGMESRRRAFPASLRRMVVLRDDTCRTPYCDGRIQDIDHATPYREGGPTSWQNASGLCAACNQIKENTGWTHQATPEHLSVTTPTGHRYSKDTGPVLEGIPPDKQEPPDEEPRPQVRATTDCFAKTTQSTLTLRLAA
ncbi:HNH endonuclease, partial [Yaniella sp.]|uniref:HNH endonuclease n=1 Tax=Yaniella sp. TaxID=2773929 RepID=UPI002647BFCD